uniref:SFRICE_004020 n=1 Tax=Spodoptera frugiperda TaxID=7108 RepID=A0A2H1VDP5_SPOFR
MCKRILEEHLTVSHTSIFACRGCVYKHASSHAHDSKRLLRAGIKPATRCTAASCPATALTVQSKEGRNNLGKRINKYNITLHTRVDHRPQAYSQGKTGTQLNTDFLQDSIGRSASSSPLAAGCRSTCRAARGTGAARPAGRRRTSSGTGALAAKTLQHNTSHVDCLLIRLSSGLLWLPLLFPPANLAMEPKFFFSLLLIDLPMLPNCLATEFNCLELLVDRASKDLRSSSDGWLREMHSIRSRSRYAANMAERWYSSGRMLFIVF